MPGQGPDVSARWAAATAVSTSSRDAPGTVAMTSSLQGEMTSMRSVVAARAHSPLTKIVS